MNTLEKRCVELSYLHKLTHVSSVLNTVNVLDEIYRVKNEDDPVILGNSHAALALYVVIEAYGGGNADDMIKHHGTHAGRDEEHGIWVSGGSLGQAETVAVGIAIANPAKTVWLVTSDGACAEGAIWEAFNLASTMNLTNLNIHLIANGYGAYGPIDVDRLVSRLETTLAPIPLTVHRPEMTFEWMKGLPGHYCTLSVLQYCQMVGLRILAGQAFEFFIRELGKLRGNYLEIGVFEGYMIRELSRYYPEKHFFGIDPFIEDGNTIGHTLGYPIGERLKDQCRIAHKNFNSLKNAVLFEMTSEEFDSVTSDSELREMNISAVLVDGDHDYKHTVLDLKLSARALGNRGGVIFVDDAGLPSVRKAIAEFSTRHNTELIEYSGGGILNMSPK